ncbi:methionine synthase [Lipingzhangella sp. LS1_29]|uniref:Methionine synthase n=1 Tax=Lipingzhangella rawalii TaxID=2055835 RepID=A0ABU2H9R0_9ACTN|nr:methionine synthase [Lipingzhangella rawalii]MDS1272016.1 methionine synthase [Lipingzhangella rawalii]
MSEQHRFPWPRASVTGVGSLPGTEPDEAARTVSGELPEFVHLAELPDRGPGADLVGRAAATLVDFPVEVQPSGWRVADRPGRDLWRARSLLSADLDAAEEHTQGYTGPFKLQLAGPWTLAATLELRTGQPLLADSGAVRDLSCAHAEGLAAHLAEIQRRIPGGHLVVQLDEPALTAVRDGRVPTASGYGRIAAPDPTTLQEHLREACAVIETAGAVPVVHCCAENPPIELLRRSGARAVGLDATLLEEEHDEPLAAAVEAGIALFLGLAARTGGEPSDPAATVDPVRTLWHRTGLDPETLSDTVVVTPRCGLVGLAPTTVREVLADCHTAARVLREEPRRDGRK